MHSTYAMMVERNLQAGTPWLSKHEVLGTKKACLKTRPILLSSYSLGIGELVALVEPRRAFENALVYVCVWARVVVRGSDLDVRSRDSLLTRR